MFIGHYAVGLAAKKVDPKISLGTLFLAAQLADVVWPVLVLLGIEHVRITPGITPVTPLELYDYPFTHSLIGSLGWSVLFGLTYFLVRRAKKGAVIVGLAVFSHWILDLITHRPDLPLGFGTTTYVGLGLWNSFWGTLIVEVALFAIGLYLYLSTTRAKEKIGSFGFWALMLILGISYLAAVFGPPPPSVKVIAVGGTIFGWLFVLWAYWVDAHRESKPANI